MDRPGLLTIKAHPGWNTDPDIVYDWCITEQGPLHMRLPFIWAGDAYLARDEQHPSRLVTYHVSDLTCLKDRSYTRLEDERSLRSKAVLGTLDAYDRRAYALVARRGVSDRSAPFLLTVAWEVKGGFGGSVGVDDEHMCSIAAISGWTCTTRFTLVEGDECLELKEGYLDLHEFESPEALEEAHAHMVQNTVRRADCKNHPTTPQLRRWAHDLRFKPLDEPASTIITTDGAELRYLLEGNASDPVIVCVNSILTDLHMWDDVARSLLGGVTGRTYRILRYDPRGYTAQQERSNHTNFDILADDLEYLLRRLQITRVHAVIGANVGGVTASVFAMRYPNMLGKFVACGCGIASVLASDETWADRIELVRGADMDELAEMFLRQWLTPAHRDSPLSYRLRVMMKQASRAGFEQAWLALSDYDLRPQLHSLMAPGLFVLGEGDDSKLAHQLQQLPTPLTSSAFVPNSAHLPMLENTTAFVAVLSEFL